MLLGMLHTLQAAQAQVFFVTVSDAPIWERETTTFGTGVPANSGPIKMNEFCAFKISEFQFEHSASQ